MSVEVRDIAWGVAGILAGMIVLRLLGLSGPLAYGIAAVVFVAVTEYRGRRQERREGLR